MSSIIKEPAGQKPLKGDLYISWPDYSALGLRLAKKIKNSEWECDQILCVARGGMYIGDQLSRILKKPLAITSACSYNGEVQGELKISKQIAMCEDSLCKNVLLVDDLVDSGATLTAIKKSVKEKYPEVNIKTAVIWKKTCSTFSPDYFAEKVQEGIWIHQPFENYEKISLEYN